MDNERGEGDAIYKIDFRLYMNGRDLDEQNRIDTAVVLRIVRDLSILRPDHLAVLCDQTEFADVHLDHGSLGHHAQARVHRTARVLLDADDRQIESGLQFRMCHMGVLVTQCHRTNESLELRRLSREALAHEAGLGHHSLPAFALRLAGLDHSKHVGLRLRLHFR